MVGGGERTVKPLPGVDVLAGGQPRLRQPVVPQQVRDGGVLLRRRDDRQPRRGTARRALSTGHRPRVVGEHEAVARGRTISFDQPPAAFCTPTVTPSAPSSTNKLYYQELVTWDSIQGAFEKFVDWYR